MTDSDDIDFLSIIACKGLKMPYFVRAKTVREAHVKTLEKAVWLDTPAWSIETFVIDGSMLKEVLPNVDMKALCRHYWTMGSRDVGADINEAEFEVAWNEHGISIDDE